MTAAWPNLLVPGWGWDWGWLLQRQARAYSRHGHQGWAGSRAFLWDLILLRRTIRSMDQTGTPKTLTYLSVCVHVWYSIYTNVTLIYTYIFIKLFNGKMLGFLHLWKC